MSSKICLNNRIILIIVVLILFSVNVIAFDYEEYKAKEPFSIDKELGWSNKPNHISSVFSEEYGRNITYIHNSEGIRTEKEITLEKTRPRIAIIGDSFVYGVGLDQYDLIGSRLQESLPEYEIISAGTIGYSTTQYEQIYYYRLRKYNPDIVIFISYVNDFAENSYQEIFSFIKNWYHTIEFDNATQEYSLEKKGIAESLDYDDEKRKERVEAAFAENEKDEVTNIIGKFFDQFSKKTWDVSPLRENQGWSLFEREYDEKSKYEVLLQGLVIDDSKKLIESDDSTFLVVYLPARVQVDETYAKEVFSGYEDITYEDFEFRLINNLLIQMQSKYQFNLLDTTQAFLDYDGPGKLYLPDGHLSPDGTRLIDNQIYDYLKEKGLVIQ